MLKAFENKKIHIFVPYHKNKIPLDNLIKSNEINKFFENIFPNLSRNTFIKIETNNEIITLLKKIALGGTTINSLLAIGLFQWSSWCLVLPALLQLIIIKKTSNIFAACYCPAIKSINIPNLLILISKLFPKKDWSIVFTAVAIHEIVHYLGDNTKLFKSKTDIFLATVLENYFMNQNLTWYKGTAQGKKDWQKKIVNKEYEKQLILLANNDWAENVNEKVYGYKIGNYISGMISGMLEDNIEKEKINKFIYSLSRGKSIEESLKTLKK